MAQEVVAEREPGFTALYTEVLSPDEWARGLPSSIGEAMSGDWPLAFLTWDAGTNSMRTGGPLLGGR